MSPIRRMSRRRAAIFGVIAALILALPMAVLASHQFDDVPTDHLFHSDIDALADAGITGGCSADNYCPGSFVTRGQMAAFLNRLGALAPGKVPKVNADKVDGWDSTSLLPGGTLPTGRTLKGSFGIFSSGTAIHWDMVSFGYTLPAAPTVHFITAGDAVPAGCSGSVASPGASAGHLCLFESESEGKSGFECVFDPDSFDCGVGNRHGFGLSESGAAAGTWYTFGTWAVTAGSLSLTQDSPPTDGPRADGS